LTDQPPHPPLGLDGRTHELASDQARIQPLRREDWTAETMRALGALAEREPLENVFATFARYPDLLRRYSVFGTHILRKSSLTSRTRELVILRIGRLNSAEYEFAQHARLARQAGITDAEIAAVRRGSQEPIWNDEDRLVLRATEELFDGHIISDTTWAGLAARYSLEQMMDLTYTVGCYNMISWALNSFRVQPDDALVMWTDPE
jgi:4-carboxymuconolactone decarboxylase